MPSQTEPPQPRVIAGRYEMRSVLGSGSMGTVWAAWDGFLHRPVAVKEVRLPGRMPQDEVAEVAERALREARAIASLSHPNVITLHDVIREAGRPYVVMELLNARSLAGLVADGGPLDDDQAAPVAEALAAALEAAHAAGITHRDVKPANVLVSADGWIKLTDFGIARNVADAAMTSSGIMLGSPAYMAPEVAAGKGAGPAADLWGLGATLYAITEGRPPYDADGDPLATANAVVDQPVPRPSPGPLASIISGLMIKEPAARMSPQAVRDAVRELQISTRRPLFDPALFDDVDHPTTMSESPTVAKTSAQKADEDTAPELADDPGPLPFDTTELAKRSALSRRGPKTIAVAVVAAVAAFLATGAAGFTAARLISGQSLLPQTHSAQERDTNSAGVTLKTVRGDATMLTGDTGGRFSIKVPKDWSRFTVQHPKAALPAGTDIKFVSPDGSYAVDVVRYPKFPGGKPIKGYLEDLRKMWGPNNFVLAGRHKAPHVNAIDATYRTVEPQNKTGGENSQGSRIVGRSVIARLIRAKPSLWVISVTVPSEQENYGKTSLFNRIVPTFQHD